MTDSISATFLSRYSFLQFKGSFARSMTHVIGTVWAATLEPLIQRAGRKGKAASRYRAVVVFLLSYCRYRLPRSLACRRRRRAPPGRKDTPARWQSAPGDRHGLTPSRAPAAPAATPAEANPAWVRPPWAPPGAPPAAAQLVRPPSPNSSLRRQQSDKPPHKTL